MLKGGDDVLVACTIGDLSWLKRGVSQGLNISARNKEGMNGLHLAAKNGRLDCLRYLLDNSSVSVNEIATSTGNTALHYCISKKNALRSLQCMKLLLERGADQNRQNKAGQTSLHVAARTGHVKCLKTLLECSANIHIMDKDRRTAYDHACLYGQHECARLLQALHWASNKDASLSEKLEEEAIQKKRERETRALQARLRKEATNSAYSSWLKKKNVDVTKLPNACEKRRHVRSQSHEASSCRSCSETTSLRQSAVKRHPKQLIPIKISLHQAGNNTHSVGKPDQMYPYTNYPPKALRRHSSPGKLETTDSKSIRSSRTPSVVSRGSTPVPAKYCSKFHKQKFAELSTANVKSHDQKDDTKSDQAVEDVEAVEENQHAESVAHYQNSLREEKVTHQVGTPPQDGGNWQQSSTDQSLLFAAEDDDEDLDDDLAFHDVGHTNSVEALGLPRNVMKGRTAAEIIHLLRFFGNPGPKHYGRSHSFSHGNPRHGVYRNKYQRRFSLGAIPEGQIVTSYSDEDASVSQLLDDQYFETVMHGYGNSNGEQRRVAWGEDANQSPENEEDTYSGSDTESLHSEDSEEDAQTLGVSGISPQGPSRIVHSTSDSQLLERRRQAKPVTLSQISALPSHRVTPPRTLKIVNIAWDPKSNSVQSQVTTSHLTPNDREIPSRKPTPPRRIPKTTSPYYSRSPSPHELRSSPIATSPIELHPRSQSPHSRSPSPYELKISPRSPSPQELRTSPRSALIQPTFPNWGLRTQPAFVPAHSLFAMGSIASKSMVFGGQQPPAIEEFSPARRAKSAPNLRMEQFLKSSFFEFGGTLKPA